MGNSEHTGWSAAYAVGEVVGVITRKQTYKNLLYLLVAFPLGLVYHLFFTFGLAFGVAFIVFLVGFGILFVTLLVTRVAADFERRMANVLLGTDIARPADVDRKVTGVYGTARAYLDAASTWRSLGFLLLKLWIGVSAFVLITVTLGVALSLLTAPLGIEVLDIQILSQDLSDLVDTVPRMIVAVPLGAVLIVVAFHLINGFAYVAGRVAEALLG